jgi:hypothetical protein
MTYKTRKLIRKASAIILLLALFAFILDYFFAEDIGLTDNSAFFNIRLILLILVFIFGFLRVKYKP